MKKVIIVSKTHLDLGFTGLAGEIRDTYINKFIPNSIKIAQEVNCDGKKFVWTVGSWILKKALESNNVEQNKLLLEACARGDIVAHGIAFTTHTELMDKDLTEYSLSIIKQLDKKFNRKTIAAKMTDVPGHTIALVPILAKAGIKLLHIGVNAASAVPQVPQCFLWKYAGCEIIVIYEGSYGGAYKSDIIDEILYFDHSLDNCGPRNCSEVINNYNNIKAKYQGYEVVAGSLDEYAELLWKVKDRLPEVTSEIGDSWIHGIATDPNKVAAMRELMSLKNQWLQDGKLIKGSEEYNGFADNLICIAEHTWGVNSNWQLRDYQNYLRKDFDEARKLDIKIKRGGIYKLKCFRKLAYRGAVGKYKQVENSWQEQREYLNSAILCLSEDKRKIAFDHLKKLTPKYQVLSGEIYQANTNITLGDWAMAINTNGGIARLTYNNQNVMIGNDKAILQYRSYGSVDYDYWLKNYTRDYLTTRSWAVGDFARPNLKRIQNKYKQGRFDYTMTGATISKSDKNIKIAAMLSIDEYCYNKLGASNFAQVIYTLSKDGLDIELIYCDKPANRLPEATFFRLYPDANKSNFKYIKLDSVVNPYDVVIDGNRNNSCVEKIIFGEEENKYKIINDHSPLVSLGRGKILEFDNKLEDVKEEGISYILNNNIWGTNFPLWNEGNAYFKFKIRKSED